MFPEYPPFGGAFESIIPHLTVAHGNAEEAEVAAQALSAAMQAHGRIVSRCTSVELFENSTGMWKVMHSFSMQNAHDTPA